MPAVFQRPAARRDLVAHYVYLAENAGMKIAERFLMNTESSFTEISAHPHIGSPTVARSPTLAGFRRWRIKEFKEIIIFYLRRRNGVTSLRISPIRQTIKYPLARVVLCLAEWTGFAYTSAGRRFAGRRIASSPAESRAGGFLHSTRQKNTRSRGCFFIWRSGRDSNPRPPA